jgi:CheY-like chemotaxis protein
MSSGPTASTTNVLVVEDEMVLRMRAVDIVEDAGFTAVEAVNAAEALSILESRSDISLLFSDIQMPGSMEATGSRPDDCRTSANGGGGCA